MLQKFIKNANIFGIVKETTKKLQLELITLQNWNLRNFKRNSTNVINKC